MELRDPEDIIEEVSRRGALKSSLLACLRERLTREAGAEDVVFGDGGDIDLPDITRRLQAKVLLVQLAEGGV
jgi:hypothetical protein